MVHVLSSRRRAAASVNSGSKAPIPQRKRCTKNAGICIKSHHHCAVDSACADVLYQFVHIVRVGAVSGVVKGVVSAAGNSRNKLRRGVLGHGLVVSQQGCWEGIEAVDKAGVAYMTVSTAVDVARNIAHAAPVGVGSVRCV